MGYDLFSSVQPRDDVLGGTLSDAVFAASLEEVAAGSAPENYADAKTFFVTTHPSGGLRTLLNEALGRVGGGKPDAAPVIRLETNLGGGKTHNLIALYHAACGALPSDLASDFMDPGLLPAEPVSGIAVIVGTALGASSFPEVADIRPNTVWGHLALQLGGRDAYELIRGDDEGRTAPGSRALKEIFARRPTLVLLDELARYLAAAQGVPVGKTTLADQTVAFLMALMEAAAGEPRTCVVVTMTEPTDPFGEDTERMVAAFDEAQELIGRRAQALRPSDEADLPAILSRRLFARVDSSAASEVAAAYAEAASEAYARGTDLPERMTTGGAWQGVVERTYPFHPELIRILDKRLSTIPNFQRTRGALRLLARGVRLLWQARPERTLLVHPHHLDLGDPDIAEDLSSRLDRPRWEPVIRADVASKPGAAPSHAEQVDHQMGAQYASQLAATIYLYSLTTESPGISAPELIGAVLALSDDPGIVTKALDQLEQACWYLHTDVRGYRFSTEASLVRLIHDAESRITQGKVKAAATDILARQFGDATLKVKRTWEDPNVPDRADDAYLVMFHWDELLVDDPSAPVPDKIKQLWEKTPAGANRTYRNRIVFLTPNSATHQQMLRAVRRHLALKELATSDVVVDLTPEKREELKNKARESDLEARVAVCNHVNVLYVPETGGLRGYGLDLVTQASLKRNQTEAIVDRLAAMEKTLAAGDRPLDPQFIRSRLGARLDQPISTEDLVRAFAARSDLKLVLDRAMLRKLIEDGIRQGVWDYHDVERGEQGWATADRPLADIRIADNTYLHPPGSAPSREVAACPLCGQVHEGPCPELREGPGGPPPPPADSVFTASGSAAVAFNAARQAAMDAARRELYGLHVEVRSDGEGTGVQLARLHALLPASRLGASPRYEVNVTAQLGQPTDRLQVVFSGTPAQYQPVKAAVDQVLRTRPAVLHAVLDVTFDQPWRLSGEEVEELRRRAAETGPTSCTVTLTTERGA